MIRIVYNPTDTIKQLIEIQGEILHTSEESYEGMDFGKLIKKDNGAYSLLVGNHILEGKLIKLKNPHILLRKIKDNNNPESTTQYIEVKDIFYEKILFSSRPTPLLCQSSIDKQLTYV